MTYPGNQVAYNKETEIDALFKRVYWLVQEHEWEQADITMAKLERMSPLFDLEKADDFSTLKDIIVEGLYFE